MAQATDRANSLKTLSETKFDILILGGGATGAGTALDASLRGYKVALLDRKDFSSGTSSRSTKLIHGGVRYLAQLHFKLIHEALTERKRLLKNAPHLVKPLPFLMPTYKWYEKPYYSLGLTLYDLLAGSSTVPGHQRVSRRQALDFFPSIKRNGLKGGIKYYDAQFNDSRLNIATIRGAKEAGASILSQVEVTGFLKKDNQIIGVTATDLISKKKINIHARVVANTTGVWIDEIRKMDDPNTTPVLSPSQGIHLVFSKEKIPCKTAMIIPKTEDGRVVFIIPWEGKVIMGTTDTPIKSVSEEPLPLGDEVAFLLKTGNDYLDAKLTKDDIQSVFSGLRPLISLEGNQNTKSISREEAILVSESGLVTMSGGKWSTYRKMGEDLTNRLIEESGLEAKGECMTYNYAFPGTIGYTKDLFRKLQSLYAMDEFTALRLADTFGGETELILGKKPKEIKKGSGYFEEEIVHFVKNEFALSVTDVLARRWRVLFLDLMLAKKLAEPVSKILTKQLKWTETKRKASLKELNDLISSLEKSIA